MANESVPVANPWVDVSDGCSKRLLATGGSLIVARDVTGWQWTMLDQFDAVLDVSDRAVGYWSEKELAQGDAERHAEKRGLLPT